MNIYCEFCLLNLSSEIALGIDGFERYVSLAILGRNIQKLGAILIKEEQKRRWRKLRKLEKLKKAA